MNKVTVTYGYVPPPPPPHTITITAAEYDMVLTLCLVHNMKVTSIKFIRQQYGLGLKDAKDVCDAIEAAGPRP